MESATIGAASSDAALASVAGEGSATLLSAGETISSASSTAGDALVGLSDSLGVDTILGAGDTVASASAAAAGGFSDIMTLGIGGLAASRFMNFFVKGGATIFLSEIFFVAICAYLVAQSSNSEDIAPVETHDNIDESSVLEQVGEVQNSDGADIETALPPADSVVQGSVDNEA